MKKICVFPNDPLKSYFKKGEIKPRYFNPKNIFDEVHVISLFDDDIEEEKVKTVAGDALFKIHVVGLTQPRPEGNQNLLTAWERTNRLL